MPSTFGIDIGLGFPQQDYILLGGKKSPGIADVAGASSKRNWNVRQGYGLSGATIVYIGDELARFAVEISIWEQGHFSEWEEFAAVFDPPDDKRRGALSIEHPLLNRPPLLIDSVVVEDVTQFKQDDQGLWTCVISLLQFRKPEEAVVRPDNTPKSIKTTTPDAKTAGEIELVRVRAELQAVATRR